MYLSDEQRRDAKQILDFTTGVKLLVAPVATFTNSLPAATPPDIGPKGDHHGR